MKTVVVSRHKSFVEYLREKNIIPADVEVKAHVSAKHIKGAHVIGILPPHLAIHAECVTAIPLDLSLEQRERERTTGEDLTLSEIRRAAGTPFTYRVMEAKAPQ